jgi:glyoxylase-like metal-dependent hydrolase (beta-lactamase superfamily II)
MLQMHVVHAHEGDCLLLESGDGDDPKFILVDGGPRDTYEPHLRSVLRSKVARNGGRLEAVVLSHVDADHVTGLLDLFVELRSSEDEGEDPLVTIREIWHNAFGDTVARGTDIVPRFRALMDTVAASRGLAGLELTALALSSIAQGARLEREARLHGV